MNEKKILGEVDPSLYEKTIYPDPEPLERQLRRSAIVVRR